MPKDLTKRTVERVDPGAVVATNAIAASLLDGLRSGLMLKGTVRSYTANGLSGTAWIAMELPGIGSRDVAVHIAVDSECRLQAGQQVQLQCVPNPLHPGRFVFRIVPQSTVP